LIIEILVFLLQSAAGIEIDHQENVMTTAKNLHHMDGVSTGLRQGKEVFVQSVVSGFSGLIEEPVKGMSDGIVGAVAGTCKGVLRLVAAPVAGALGAVSVMTESIERSAKFWRGRPVGRRRARRMNQRSPIKSTASLRSLNGDCISGAEESPSKFTGGAMARSEGGKDVAGEINMIFVTPPKKTPEKRRIKKRSGDVHFLSPIVEGYS